MKTRIHTDIAVVGSGPCGALVARELAERGMSVVVLEAGQRFGLNRPLQNSEANAGKIMWSEPRNHVGADCVAPKAGMGVGGGTLPWLGVMPRFHRDDFRAHSSEGVGDDWPISYDDLRPHYAKVEREFGVAGECGPSAPESYKLPMRAHRMSWHAQLLARGARKLGAKPFAPPIAINSEERDGRPACVYCGWCASGCPTEAKATAANTYLLRAERFGARVISEAFVHRVTYDGAKGRATGVEYLDSQGREHRIDAKLLVLAAHAIETPRLLLMSANATFPDGLANSSGMVGRNFMSHPTWQVFGTFDEPVNAFKGMQMGHLMVQDHYRPDPRNGYARGFILLSYMMTPVTYGNLSGLMFGPELKDFLYDYPRTAAWWAHAEGLPDARNTITLDPDMRDARGLPVARVSYRWGSNDVKVAAAARDKAAEMMAASGARKVRIGLNYGAHAMGSCRMGRDPKTSVVNAFCQSHDVANLFICDTSVFVTGSGLNPTLTAMAIADRAAFYIGDSAAKGEL
ncbi:MAG: GMC family oxidoreductase [Verrucomicrobia bacterium]|nr:GMC family oxidoreductase [Verrucomicrobiota bacterium]MBI3868775.1 GMC family oxidoreductase [Verrucomicrobiota bacterium]